MPNLAVIRRGDSPDQVIEVLNKAVADALHTPDRDLVIDLTDLEVITGAVLKCLLRPNLIDFATARSVQLQTASVGVTRVASAYRLGKIFDIQLRRVQ